MRCDRSRGAQPAGCQDIASQVAPPSRTPTPVSTEYSRHRANPAASTSRQMRTSAETAAAGSAGLEKESQQQRNAAPPHVRLESDRAPQAEADRSEDGEGSRRPESPPCDEPGDSEQVLDPSGLDDMPPALSRALQAEGARSRSEDGGESPPASSRVLFPGGEILVVGPEAEEVGAWTPKEARPERSQGLGCWSCAGKPPPPPARRFS